MNPHVTLLNFGPIPRTVYYLSIELCKPSTDIAYKKINRLLKSGKDKVALYHIQTIGLQVKTYRFSCANL